MKPMPNSLSRRAFLGGVVVLPALAAILSRQARADGSKASQASMHYQTSQASMHYQTSPNDGMQCSGCNFFIPGQDASSDGSCKIVDGTISPHGYCIAYAAKS